MVDTAAEAEAEAAQETAAETTAKVEGMEPKALEMTERASVSNLATAVASMAEARWVEVAVLNRSHDTSR
jgi:hypothetical protein